MRFSTSKDLYLEERRQKILKWVEQAGRVSVAELSRRFGVSEVTIRTDLQALADRKLIIRTHGGAIPTSSHAYELALTLRQRRQVREKKRIGKASTTLMADGDAVFIDSSSTALTGVQYLKQYRQLTVITNSLVVAQELLDTPEVTVVMPGGVLQRDMASLAGTDGLAMLRKFNIRKGFFGAHGLTLAEGLTDVSADEAEVKRFLVGLCRQVIIVLDATKWGQVGLASFARLEDVDVVITDVQAPPDLVEQVRALDIEVITV